MTRIATRLGLAVAMVCLTAGAAPATTQLILGRKLYLRSPSVDADKRKVTGQGRESSSPNTIVGTPSATGASLRVITNGGTNSDQTFALPAPGWSAIGSLGFKYSNKTTGGAVKKASIKRTTSGIFQIKMSIKGSDGPVAIVPPNPGDDGGFILTITGGDSYCVGFGGAAGGFETKDTAEAWLVRNPSAEACPVVPPTTTTSTTASTTSSITFPPSTNPGPTTTSTTTVSVTTSSTTNTSPTTTTTLIAGCDCCAYTKLAFTSGLPDIGGGGCGAVSDGSSTLLALDCGGLYFGGGGVTTPQPAGIPDMATSITKVENCAAGVFDLAATTAADTGSHRTCTSGGAADPDYPACVGGTRDGLPCTGAGDCPPPGTCSGTMPGCLFGPPLPIPNPGFAGASVCIVNRVSSDATGSGTCGGVSLINIPIASDLYLEGDLLDGSAPNRPNVGGIQPCPICTAGGSCASGTCCKGGPRHDLDCTPGSSALGESYPTSHGCPPPPGALGSAYIGALPIPFALTTDPNGTSSQAHKVATSMNNQNVFCGFCGAALSPTFKNPPVPCTSNADCAGLTGCPSTTACTTCKQRTSGAFGFGEAVEITEFGTPADVCLSDGDPHEATLVSIFCIPPSFNATVDVNGDLPGPGAVALAGAAQLTDPIVGSTTTSTTTTSLLPGSSTTSTTLMLPDCGNIAPFICNAGSCPVGQVCLTDGGGVCGCMAP